MSTEPDAGLYVAWVKDDADDSTCEPVCRVSFFGGTVNRTSADGDPTRIDHNNVFMAMHVKRVEELIQSSFAHIGSKEQADPAQPDGPIDVGPDRQRSAMG